MLCGDASNIRCSAAPAVAARLFRYGWNGSVSVPFPQTPRRRRRRLDRLVRPRLVTTARRRRPHERVDVVAVGGVLSRSCPTRAALQGCIRGRAEAAQHRFADAARRRAAKDKIHGGRGVALLNNKCVQHYGLAGCYRAAASARSKRSRPNRCAAGRSTSVRVHPPRFKRGDQQ